MRRGPEGGIRYPTTTGAASIKRSKSNTTVIRYRGSNTELPRASRAMQRTLDLVNIRTTGQHGG